MAFAADTESQSGVTATDQSSFSLSASRSPIEGPASRNQYALWAMAQREPDSCAYNLVYAIKVSGQFNRPAMERAALLMTERHEAFRTTFAERNGKLIRLVHDHMEGNITFEDIQGVSEQALQARLSAEVYRPFDMARGPLARLLILQIDVAEWVLVFAMHHSIVDLWSYAISLYELGRFYTQEVTGVAARLRPIQVTYTDYVQQQEALLSNSEGEALWSYWRKQLEGKLVPLNLPTDRARPLKQTCRGAVQSLSVDVTLTQALKDLSETTNVPLHVVLLTAFQTLLHRYTGQDYICVGYPKANRSVHFARMVGYFVNPLMMCADFSGDPSFWDLLIQMRDTVERAFAHDAYPYSALVERLQVSRNFSNLPLFETVFSWYKTARLGGNFSLTPAFANQAREFLKFADLEAEVLPLAQRAVSLEPSLAMAELDGELVVAFEYNTDIFEDQTAHQFLGHFVCLLQSIIADPKRRVSQLPLMTEHDRQSLLARWGQLPNSTSTATVAATLPSHSLTSSSLSALLEAQAAEMPDHVAVMGAETTLTYRELDLRATQLAHDLRVSGIGTGSRVGMCVERGPDMIVGLLAILKAGATYLPLDTDYPQRRMAYILEDAQVALLVTQKQLAERLAVHHVPQLHVDDVSTTTQSQVESFPCPATADDIAYIIYTSDSSGQPKGVLVTYGMLLAHSQTIVAYYQLTDQDRVLQFLPLTSDASLEQIVPTLLAGATVVLREETLWSPKEFYRKVQTAALTVIVLPAAYWRQIVAGWTPDFGDAALSYVRLLVVGGDVMSPETVRLWQQGPLSHARLFNVYGPAETTITALAFEIPPGFDLSRRVPIGYPLPGRRVYVLDAHHQPVPPGGRGELYLGGVGVARGYLNRQELTDEFFIPNPFVAGERLYKTGDMVRCRHDGAIEFLGRADLQVKIRGFRVELGEIEAALLQHPDVCEAVVSTYEDMPGDPQLVGYVVLNQKVAFSAHALRDFLKERLLAYMIPTDFVTLDALPMLPGEVEVDRQSLPVPEHLAMIRETPYSPPTTALEKQLVEIWSQALGNIRIGVQDNFFELGGDSLKAVRVISRLWQAFAVELPLRTLFDNATIAHLAEQIEHALSNTPSAQSEDVDAFLSNLPPLVHRNFEDPVPLSFAQEHIWFLNQLAPASSAYNIIQAVRLEGDLNEAALTHAFQELVLRHPALRTKFPVIEDVPVQVIHPTVDVALRIVDLRTVPPTERAERAQQMAEAVARQLFDLQHDTLIRGGLLRLEDTVYILIVNMHHMVVDVYSVGTLVTELAHFYNAYIADVAVSLPALPVQYTDFAVWQRAWLQGDELAARLTYWREQLHGISLLELPTDHPRPAVQRYHGRLFHRDIPEELLARLRHLSVREGVSLAMLLLAVYNVLLYRYTGQEDIAIGLPAANRPYREIENVIGTFVNTLILRTDLSDNPRFLELLTRVRDVALDAYAHQDLPYAKLVGELHPTRDTSHAPLIQVMFNVINVPIPALHLTNLKATPFVVESGGAQFDLTLTIVDTEITHEVHIGYNTDLFEFATIERLFDHYLNLLQQIVADPEQHISTIPLLPDAEYQQMVYTWNATTADYPRAACIHHLIEAQVQQTPDAIAVGFNGTTMTYRELDAHANRLAHYFQKQGIMPGDLVGVHIPRSPDMLISVLGILKVGAYYLPLDPTYPWERISFMVQDARPSLLLTTAKDLTTAAQDVCLVVNLKREWAIIEKEPSGACIVDVISDNLAYIIYTSGSTGKPKGVLIPHRAVVNFLYSMLKEPGLTAADILLSVTSLSFDIAGLEIFLPLIIGARVELVSDDIAVDGASLMSVMTNVGATVMQATPTTWRLLLASGWQGRAGLKVLCGGEPLDASLAQSLLERCAAVWNMYGPTETTIWSSLSPITDPEHITIGRPINNTQMYILDSAMQPVPIGVPGDLYIGGDGVGQGYHHRPDLTAARFLPNPFDPAFQTRLYQTGDRARFLANGEIVILGRLDHQIKLRGHRVELGEIEAALLEHEAVSQAAVVVSEDTDELNKHLIACVVCHAATPPSIKSLQTFLGETLPQYMIPTAFVYLDTMPMTPNGKVDRNGLACQATIPTRESVDHIPPRDFIEFRLVEIWKQVLNLESVGIRDNFFELGGHSLLAVYLFSQIEKQLGLKLPVVMLFQAPTIEQLGTIIRRDEGTTGWDALVPITATGTELPFFCVHGVGGGVLDYSDLAKLLGPEQPFYALQAQGLDGEVVSGDRIEDMAAYYIRGIKKVQPAGPYALGGYSFGGVVAFEMACQLQEMGERVALLAMLETYAPLTHYWTWTPKSLLYFILNLPRWIIDVVRHKGGLPRLYEQVQNAFRAFLTRPRLDTDAEAGQVWASPTLVDVHIAALEAYRPRSYAGHVTLFRVPGMALFRPHDPQYGWGQLATDGVTIRMLSGAHYSILERPQAVELAENLRDSLWHVRHPETK